MIRIALLLGLLLPLAACGRVGPINPPGPPERITFPRQYPAPERAVTPPASPR